MWRLIRAMAMHRAILLAVFAAMPATHAFLVPAGGLLSLSLRPAASTVRLYVPRAADKITRVIVRVSRNSSSSLQKKGVCCANIEETRAPVFYE